MSNPNSLNRRIGNFSVPADDIRDRKPYVFNIFNNMLIIRAEMQYYDMSVHYTAICEDFEEVTQGAVPKEYKYEVSLENGSIKWTKV